MAEKIIENVINEMIPHLNQGQLEHLSNVLYVNFHGKEIREECTELIPSGMEGMRQKLRCLSLARRR